MADEPTSEEIARDRGEELRQRMAAWEVRTVAPNRPFSARQSEFDLSRMADSPQHDEPAMGSDRTHESDRGLEREM